MRSYAEPFAAGNVIRAEVLIQRPVNVVYDFYRDFRNMPKFLGDVLSVERTGTATYRWKVEGPFHTRVQWMVRVTEERRNELLRYETVDLKVLRTLWAVSFSPEEHRGQTKVCEIMRLPLGRLGRILLAVLGKSPAGEVGANLHRLKQVLEAGTVSDRRFALASKFTPSANEEED